MLLVAPPPSLRRASTALGSATPDSCCWPASQGPRQPLMGHADRRFFICSCAQSWMDYRRFGILQDCTEASPGKNYLSLWMRKAAFQHSRHLKPPLIGHGHLPQLARRYSPHSCGKTGEVDTDGSSSGHKPIRADNKKDRFVVVGPDEGGVVQVKGRLPNIQRSGIAILAIRVFRIIGICDQGELEA